MNRPLCGKAVFFFCWLLFLSVKGYGQQGEQELVSDRPDQTEASAVVPKGTFQLEAGLLFQKDSEAGLEIRNYAYPSALLRWGVLDWLELRVRASAKDSVVENSSRQNFSGVGPLGVGTKIKLWEGQGWRPEAALMATVTLPVGSRSFRPDDPEPELRLAFMNEITQKLEVQYNLVYGRTGGDLARGYAVSMSGDLSDKLTLYGEVFGRKQKGEKAEHQADGGFLFLLRPSLQLDVAVGRRLNKAAPDYFVTTGFSLRLPR
ncbi:MAG: transporter [Hymenobacteraceae bacterium]|nr:transporter [Hymenobacteraceae bacterium]